MADVHWPAFIGTEFTKTLTSYTSKAEYDANPSTATTVDYTGWSGSMVVRRRVGDGTAVATLSTAGTGMTLGGTAGTVALVMDDSVTVLISVGIYVFDIILTDTSSNKQPPLIDGEFEFQRTSTLS